VPVVMRRETRPGVAVRPPSHGGTEPAGLVSVCLCPFFAEKSRRPVMRWHGIKAGVLFAALVVVGIAGPAAARSA